MAGLKSSPSWLLAFTALGGHCSPPGLLVCPPPPPRLDFKQLLSLSRVRVKTAQRPVLRNVCSPPAVQIQPP